MKEFVTPTQAPVAYEDVIDSKLNPAINQGHEVENSDIDVGSPKVSNANMNELN